MPPKESRKNSTSSTKPQAKGDEKQPSPSQTSTSPSQAEPQASPEPTPNPSKRQASEEPLTPAHLPKRPNINSPDEIAAPMAVLGRPQPPPHPDSAVAHAQRELEGKILAEQQKAWNAYSSTLPADTVTTPLADSQAQSAVEPLYSSPTSSNESVADIQRNQAELPAGRKQMKKKCKRKQGERKSREFRCSFEDDVEGATFTTGSKEGGGDNVGGSEAEGDEGGSAVVVASEEVMQAMAELGYEVEAEIRQSLC